MIHPKNTMNEGWYAEIANDPTRDFDLYVEIYESNQHRASIQRNPDGVLVLHLYKPTEELLIPATWLCDVLTRADRDLPKSSPVE